MVYTNVANVGTGADDATVGTVSWSSPGEVTSDNTTYATAALNNAIVSHYLKMTNFGFVIASTATIVAIQLDFKRSMASGADAINDSSIKAVRAGTIIGTDQSAGTAWPSSDTIRTFGDQISNLWGTTWTPTQMNDNTTGFVVSCVSARDGSTARARFATATITYTAPGRMRGTVAGCSIIGVTPNGPLYIAKGIARTIEVVRTRIYATKHGKV